MKITDIKTFLVHPGRAKNLCFVKIETDEGIYGWGECYTQSDRDVQITAHVDQLKRYLIGRDPTNIKHFMQMAFDDFAGRRGAMDYYCAISGLEHAMWDIAGKAYGAPVHKLIGGACRDKIRVYANGWSGGNPTPESLAERASEVIEAGFTALKFDPIPGRWRTYVGKDVEDAAVENVRAVREAVGPDVDILVEMHRRLAPMHAVRIAHEIEQYRPFWYEEPVLAENIPALASVRQKINIPVVTGEELYTKFEFREVFEKQAADILNPDVCNVGGILELKEIAAMAEPYFVVISPHNFNSTTVGLGGNHTGLRRNPQLPHNRILRQPRRPRQRHRQKPLRGARRLHPTARHPRPRHRPRRRAPRRLPLQALPRKVPRANLGRGAVN